MREEFCQPSGCQIIAAEAEDVGLHPLKMFNCGQSDKNYHFGMKGMGWIINIATSERIIPRESGGVPTWDGPQILLIQIDLLSKSLQKICRICGRLCVLLKIGKLGNTSQ